MLTKRDLQLINQNTFKIITEEFSNFAILMQNEFKVIHAILETKADKIDLETKADKTDIIRLENKLEGRIEKAEDNIRIIKTKLKIA